MSEQALIRDFGGSGRRPLPQRISIRLLRVYEFARMLNETHFGSGKALLLCLSIVFSGCAQKRTPGPAIEFTRIPLVGEGGPDKLDTIEGRVVGATPGGQIVLYAKWGTWWVQPLADQPFTSIQEDSTWRSSTHFGTEYAALLVDSEYRPLAKLDTLPSEGPGIFAVAIIKGRPVFWQTWWFLLGAGIALALAATMLFRVKMNRATRQLSLRLEERLAERTRVAEELHDTLLQDFLSVSMQLHLADDQLDDDSPAKPLVTRALEMMARAIQEGRNTLQGLRSSHWGSQDLEQAFSRIQQELAITREVRFRVIVAGTARPLRPLIGDDIYLIGREALANAFHHSGASEIEVEIEYGPNQLRVFVRDNGCGIAGDRMRSTDAEQRGLSRICERTGKMGAQLRVLSRAKAGTEMELRIPGDIVYLHRDSDRPARWFSRLHSQKAKVTDSLIQSERVQ
jgi:signal transduction histidine kinase